MGTEAIHENTNGKKLTLREVQKHLIGAFVGGSLTAIVMGVVFYFNTTYTLNAHTTKFNDFDKRLNRTEERMEAFTGELTILKVDVREVKEAQKQMKEDISQIKNDVRKIYEVLIDLKNK